MLFFEKKHLILPVFISLFIYGCGGSDGSTPELLDPNNLFTPSVVFPFEKGQFPNAEEFIGYCAEPSGLDEQQGSITDEKNFLRSFVNETYLWYDEVEDISPENNNEDKLDYFDKLKTTAITPSGRLRDQFHFAITLERNDQIEFGETLTNYGINWIQEDSNPLVVLFVEPGSNADLANVQRGDILEEFDGLDPKQDSDISAVISGLFQADINDEHDFLFTSRASGETYNVILAAQVIEASAVLPAQVIEQEIEENGTTLTKKIGYVQFLDHNFRAEKALFEAFSELENAAVDDLVLDLRYNGGGFIYIANMVSAMIAGDKALNQKFIELIYNDKLPKVSPFIHLSETVGFPGTNIEGGKPLPRLNLDRVFVLTSSKTCSASESIMNGLTGIGVEVIQIGDTTCGKPYGFSGERNCDYVYFTVQFRETNAQDFGDFADGFSPNGKSIVNSMTVGTSADLPGCLVTGDDLSAPLGDPAEAQMSTALYYMRNGVCPIDNNISSNKVSRKILKSSMLNDSPYKNYFSDKISGMKTLQ